MLGRKWFKRLAILICGIIIVGIGVNINGQQMAEYVPDNAIVGTWKATPRYNLAGETYMVNLQIHIDEEGMVTGHVGNAQLIDCTFKRNRTRFEKLLNFKTDYIIMGSLEGAINDSDVNNARSITMPLSIKDGVLRGTVFDILPMKYPEPMVFVEQCIKIEK